MEQWERNENPFDWQSRTEGQTGQYYAEDRLCERCHIRLIDISENPKSCLCTQCRNELIRLRIPPAVLISCAVVGALVLTCAAFYIRNICRAGVMMREYRSRQESAETESLHSGMGSDESGAGQASGNPGLKGSGAGETQAADGEMHACEEQSGYLGEDHYGYLGAMTPATPQLYEWGKQADTGNIVTAMDGMLSYLEDRADEDRTVTAVALTDIAMKYHYYDYAAYAINEYLMEEVFSEDVLERLNGYVDEINRYYDTYDMFDALLTGYDERLAGENADYDALIEEMQGELETCLGDAGYNQAMIYYYLGYICADSGQRARYFEECLSLDKYNFDAQAQLGVYYRRAGRMADAREILEKSYAVNREYYGTLRALATLELAEGNLEQGLSFAADAYALYPEGTYVVDTYLVALIAGGDTAQADELMAQWEEQGYTFDEEFRAYRNGEMTLEDYYIGE